MEKHRKVFNDPIHGNIELHPLCVKIVDTPQFQRLRFIKQLGGAYFVYPGAAHNRFEHSIGVCHLAGRLVRALREREDADINQDATITKEDELCVEVAGLCHDLGHGPFSHLFDNIIIPKLRADRKEWKHEKGSIDMFRYMLNANECQLRKEFEKEGIKDEDITFIEEMIYDDPVKKEVDEPENTSTKNDRKKMKGFLYEIVSNKRNGIDVDKWDYFARDSHMLGIGNNFNHDRCIAFSKVMEVNGERQICFRKKEAANLFDMFHTRYLLHTRAAKHKINNIIEIMISEALVKANEFITFPGKDGKPRKMSEAIDDMEAYTLLNDCVIYTILGSPNEDLKESKQILLRVLRRDLYKFVGEKRFDFNKFKDEDDAKEYMISVAIITKDQNIIVDLVRLNYGMKDKNPVDSVNFFSKDKPNEAGPIPREDVSLLLPKVFAEQLVRVYCKEPDKDYNNIKGKFDVWLEKTTKSAKKQKTSQ